MATETEAQTAIAPPTANGATSSLLDAAMATKIPGKIATMAPQMVSHPQTATPTATRSNHRPVPAKHVTRTPSSTNAPSQLPASPLPQATTSALAEPGTEPMVSVPPIKSNGD